MSFKSVLPLKRPLNYFNFCTVCSGQKSELTSKSFLVTVKTEFYTSKRVFQMNFQPSIYTQEVVLCMFVIEVLGLNFAQDTKVRSSLSVFLCTQKEKRIICDMNVCKFRKGIELEIQRIFLKLGIFSLYFQNAFTSSCLAKYFRCGLIKEYFTRTSALNYPVGKMSNDNVDFQWQWCFFHKIFPSLSLCVLLITDANLENKFANMKKKNKQLSKSSFSLVIALSIMINTTGSIYY